MFTLFINGKHYRVDVSPDTPLLWVIREHIGLIGTKFGCGIAQCGVCTVLINGRAERSCQTRVKDLKGKKIITIEGIPESHPVKRAWLIEDVPQCGYCQPGQIMQAISLLNEKPNPSDKDIDEHMSGCLCRCGTYQRIRKAIHLASKLMAKGRGR
ncbi:MAG: (2Fe-2S)-binding protein [Thermodesulfovibrionales bacterium]|nr:(2Fe-2S)-binding protein [Thermodesulfovibrionales bacterium]